MPFTFGAITRFAGDHLSAGYNAIDGKLGGILPGGVEVDAAGLAKDLVQDALPTKRVHGASVAEKAEANAEDAAKGRLDLVATRSRAGAVGGKLREHAVEEGVERVGREAVERLARRGGFYAVPVVGQAVAVTDTIRDGLDAYDTLVQTTTGKSYGQHVDDTIAMRDSQRGVNAFPDASYVGEGTHTIGQGTKQNPILQEIKNRATRVGQNFNPIKGDWGVSEAMGWN